MKKAFLFIMCSVTVAFLSDVSIAKADFLKGSKVATQEASLNSFQLAHSKWGRHTWCERNPRQCARERAWCARNPRECHGDRLYAHPKHHRHQRHSHRH